MSFHRHNNALAFLSHCLIKFCVFLISGANKRLLLIRIILISANLKYTVMMNEYDGNFGSEYKRDTSNFQNNIWTTERFLTFICSNKDILHVAARLSSPKM